MIHFPEQVFTDVRIETITKTKLTYEDGALIQNKSVTERGAMIRVFDGTRWYYSATTELARLQEEVDALAQMAQPCAHIEENPVVMRLERNKEELLRFRDCNIAEVPNEEKIALAEQYLGLFDELPELKHSKLYYVDQYAEKHIFSSIGTDVRFDAQSGCVVLRGGLSVNGLPYRCASDVYETSFPALFGQQARVRSELAEAAEYARNAVPVVAGEYPCVLSPETAGVFAHESFGHKSEADFMIGDETMAREWQLGSRVGAPILSIIDSGLPLGAGYVPFDDEGCRAKENYLIKDGILSGRLHSAYTAAALSESPTGNARAISFEFEPIVRMTTTYIAAGTQTLEELLAPIKEGVFVKSILHGSGMSVFTIAPAIAYMIRDGKLAEPIKISVITGNVMKTLNEVDGLSDQVELKSFGMSGCGKMEQYPLQVGFGGPYVRVRRLRVQ